MNNLKIFLNGLIKENPIFVMLLGMCPTLGTTTSAINGMGMGLATTFVLICSNVVIAALKNLIPDKVHIPVYIVIIATFVTIIQMCIEAYMPALYESLGLFIPLIVVNCIVLGRAEAFAAKTTMEFILGRRRLVLDLHLRSHCSAWCELLGTGKSVQFDAVPRKLRHTHFCTCRGRFGVGLSHCHFQQIEYETIIL